MLGITSGPLVITGLLHVLVVLLCSAYRVCSCSLLFKAPHPHPPLSLYCLYSLIHYLLTRFSTFLPVQSVGPGFFWRAGLMAGLQVGWALGCSGCLDLGSAVPVHHVRGHPISICDKGIKCIIISTSLQAQPRQCGQEYKRYKYIHIVHVNINLRCSKVAKNALLNKISIY